MQYGVYVDFFHTIQKPNSDWTLGQMIIHSLFFFMEYDELNLSEAREQAILKAVEIYNSK